ncbi:hypothetical protein [Fodinibius sediminis]|uniref:Putative mRNA 3-end processing factor n=1 Tax=Fodinibius sediminis TaxID=1214077 RepID=A0A521C4Y3_9BACT|nr:hypothetical protein [Fodinibius sediminis]SMO54395.1 putative mRNA 3-end processing factor [Fodinibius sediminis]
MNIVKAGSQGILLPDLNLEFDCSGTPEGHTFISHAHADHMPRSKESHVYCTEPTYKLMRKRGFEGTADVLAYGAPLETDRARITLYPAGHILGSAMAFVESDNGSVLYTGDYRTPPSPASEGFELPSRNIDHFITEATFALPIYRWAPHSSLADDVRTFASSSLEEGYTPVFLAYDLGKAQEVMYMLAPLNRTVQISDDCFQFCSVYEDAGFELGRYEPYDQTNFSEKILIATHRTLRHKLSPHIRAQRIAYCSGWAAGSRGRGRGSINRRIPLSDHLDFFELINLCRELHPKMVHITHTPNADVVRHYLDELNIDSRLLE